VDFARTCTTAPDTPFGPLADPWTPPSLRLVCLDIDDTLIDFTAACRRALAALLGRSDLWPVWERITERHTAMVVSGDLDYGTAHLRRTRCFLDELGADADADEVAEFERRRKELLQRSWCLFEDVLPCLDWLRAAEVLLAAVTNASGAHQRAKLEDLGLARFFDHVAIAGELGVAKPDPVMFHSVCAALGCSPQEAAHVGDKLETDAVGARDAGLEGIWLDRGSSQDSVPEGVHVIGGLDELPQLLVSEFARLGVPAQR